MTTETRRSILPILLLGAIAGPSCAASVEDAQALRAKVERFCSSELDDPGGKEYRDCSHAIESLERMLKGEPSDGETLEVLLLAKTLGSRAGAVDVARELAAVDAENFAAAYTLGLEGTGAERLESLRRAAILEPEHPEIHHRLAEAELRDAGDVDAALASMDRQIEVNPRSEEAVLNFVVLLLESDHDEAAERVVSGYLARDEIALGRRCDVVYEAMRGYGEAQARLEQTLLERCGGHALYRQAQEAMGSEEKIRLLEQVVQAESRHPSAHADLAVELLAVAGAGERVAEEVCSQIRINPLAGREVIFRVAESLAGRSEQSLAARIYKDFLRTDLSPNEKCEPFEGLAASVLEEDEELRGLLDASCGSPEAGVGKMSGEGSDGPAANRPTPIGERERRGL